MDEVLEIVDALYERAVVPLGKSRRSCVTPLDVTVPQVASSVLSAPSSPTTAPLVQQVDWRGHLGQLGLMVGLSVRSVAGVFAGQKGRCGVSGLRLSFDVGDLCCAVFDRLDREGEWFVGNLVLVCRWVRDGGGVGLVPVIGKIRGLG